MGIQRNRSQRRRGGRESLSPSVLFPWRRIVFGVALLFVALQTYPYFIHSTLGNITSSWNAAMLWGVLRAIGQHVTLDGTTVSTNTTYFLLIPECTVFAPFALFTAGVLAFPSAITEKGRALVGGALVLSLVNLFRLITLYFVLTITPHMFESIHLFVWQPIMAITALALWGIWAGRQAMYV